MIKMVTIDILFEIISYLPIELFGNAFDSISVRFCFNARSFLSFGQIVINFSVFPSSQLEKKLNNVIFEIFTYLVTFFGHNNRDIQTFIFFLGNYQN